MAENELGKKNKFKKELDFFQEGQKAARTFARELDENIKFIKGFMCEFIKIYKVEKAIDAKKLELEGEEING